MAKPRLLAIEDCPSVSRLLIEVLRDTGDLQIVATADRALELLSQSRPDLILLDLMLPGLGGLEFCALLQQDRTLASIPILVLSARHGTEIHAQAYRLGAIGFVEKPFDARELRALIDAILRQRSTGTSLRLGGATLEPTGLLCFDGTHERIKFTPSESTVLGALMRCAGSAVCRDSLLELLENLGCEASHKSLEGHISLIRRKLLQTTFIIKTHYGVGYELVITASQTSGSPGLLGRVS